MVWPGRAITRLTRSVSGPGQWSRGGWVNTTMSPWCTSCQLKNAFQTRIRSLMSRVDSMDEEGIEKTWNTNARRPSASDNATTRATAHPARARARPPPGGLPAAPSASLAPAPGSPATPSGTPPGSAALVMPAHGAAVRGLSRGDADGYGGGGPGGVASHVIVAVRDGPVAGGASAPGDARAR